MTLSAQIESILFASSKPATVKRLAELTGSSADDVNAALADLSARLDTQGSGLMLQRNGHESQMVTRPEAADLVKTAVNAEASGELTRPQLEALTILSYRGPMTRPELEQIRGIQSSLILRNLTLRGLVEEKLGRKLECVRPEESLLTAPPRGTSPSPSSNPLDKRRGATKPLRGNRPQNRTSSSARAR